MEHQQEQKEKRRRYASNVADGEAGFESAEASLRSGVIERMNESILKVVVIYFGN